MRFGRTATLDGSHRCLCDGVPDRGKTNWASPLAHGASRGRRTACAVLIDIEVTHTLRRFVRLGILVPGRAEAALSALAAVPLHRHSHVPLLAAIGRMRSNRSAYDAAYVALAESLGVPLITLDARMARTPAAVPIEVF